VNWLPDLLRTLLPRIPPEELAREAFGDIDTLKERLEAERLAAKAFGFCVGLAGAWSRKPG
jgi:hypothetical protein